MAGRDDPHGREVVSLADAAKNLLEECRMVLPGIQALFGFQLVAVFETPFPKLLTAAEQQLHLVALGLVALAAALVMTPAAYHRQTCPREVTAGFVRLSGRLLLAGLVPLAVGVTIDFYLIARVVLGSGWAAAPAVALFGAYAALWWVLPQSAALRRAVGDPEFPVSRTSDPSERITV